MGQGRAVVDLHVEAFPCERFKEKSRASIQPWHRTRRTFEAEALMANMDGRLKPGFFLQASTPQREGGENHIPAGERSELPVRRSTKFLF